MGASAGKAIWGERMMSYQWVRPWSEITAFYVLWRQDPTTTLYVHFHTEGWVGPDSFVDFRKAGTTGWQRVYGTRRQLPGSRKLIHAVEITGLEPDTTYDIRPLGREPRYQSFTMPADTTNSVRIVFGGDMYLNRLWVRRMNRLLKKFDPHLVVIGGDWAYDDGLPENHWRWTELWRMWNEDGRDSQGRVIPILGAIGSHEVQGAQFGTPEDAPSWYANISWPENGYGVMDFGVYLSLVILDTHTHTVEEQAEWLSQILPERADRPYVIPVYKWAAYPSARSLNRVRSPEIRQYWHSLFDQCPNIKVVFEKGEHTYARTVPIRGGQPHPDGIVYCGQGCWGVGIREVWNPATTWFLEDAKGTAYKTAEDGTPHEDDGKPADPDNARHFYLVTLTGEKMIIDSVGQWGNIFHTFERAAHAP